MLIMNGRGWTGEIVNLIDLDIERERHVMAEHFELRVPEKMRDVALCACVKIIKADDVMAIGDQAVAQMRP
jgi:hypothetical protein